MADMSRTAPEDRGGSMSRDGRPDPATEAFLAHRNLLFTVAYEMLGSAADAHPPQPGLLQDVFGVGG